MAPPSGASATSPVNGGGKLALCAEHAGRVGAGIGLDVILDPDALDQAQLGFQIIDVLFLALEDFLEQHARDVIAFGEGMGNRRQQIGARLLLDLQIADDDLAHVLADHQSVEILQIGQSPEKKDSLGQPIRMFHLVDGFFVFVLGQMRDAPIVQHPRMQEILVDGREFVLQNEIEEFEGLVVAALRCIGAGAGKARGYSAA